MMTPREYDTVPATHPPDGRMRRVECAVWTVRRGTPAAGTVIRGGATAAGAGAFPDRGAGGITLEDGACGRPEGGGEGHHTFHQDHFGGCDQEEAVGCGSRRVPGRGASSVQGRRMT